MVVIILHDHGNYYPRVGTNVIIETHLERFKNVGVQRHRDQILVLLLQSHRTLPLEQEGHLSQHGMGPMIHG